jgi:hypothetical protein
MKASRAACVLSWAALGCLPQSDDLSGYSSEWSPEPAGGRAGDADEAGVGGAAQESSSSADGPASAGSDGVVGSGSVPLDTSDGAAAVDAQQPAGGAGGQAGSASSAAGGAPSEVDPEGALDCGEDVLGPDGTRCYRLVAEGAFWQDARDACVAWGGALVKVETPEEDTFLSGLTPLSLWIGASDLPFDNVFVWTDGGPMFYGNWGPQQPDGFPGPDCIEKREGAGRLWFDQPCNNARAFVCERRLVPPP